MYLVPMSRHVNLSPANGSGRSESGADTFNAGVQPDSPLLASGSDRGGPQMKGRGPRTLAEVDVDVAQHAVRSRVVDGVEDGVVACIHAIDDDLESDGAAGIGHE